ncbi:ATP-binding cassette domain-containing protein [Azoarcus sp. L1K30]|uniref:ATP-binding cassette domain-containing protein n=1 Tax=Azoarcus sp. L1K30 TaxID=2820277 RepID=UPI001B825FD6|nr:ATP-binding cassette domain-containing protein [Azoarcus sp. L1K30]MBR0566017.1 ATP-binding cassette domain-containing protein [Azoarcus sp. L1K30]
MTQDCDIVLSLDQVSRSFPRDIADVPAAVLREMLWPRSLLNRPRPDSFFALRDITLQLRRGQKLGVIGAHRSGKSTLAGIASGVLHPTRGRVAARSSSLLVSRPTAGFKLALSLRENLAFRGTLAGLLGENLDRAVGRVLQGNLIDSKVAERPLGNLSPYLIRKLGMDLLLQIPAEMLVIDELVGAGAGEARLATRAALIERILASTALVVSTDFEFLKEVADQSMVLQQGRLYGPFHTELAFEHFLRQSDGSDMGLEPTSDLALEPDAVFDPEDEMGGIAHVEEAGRLTAFQSEDAEASMQEEDERFQRRSAKQALSHVAIAKRIVVDGEQYERSRLRLLRRPGETLDVSVDLLPNASFPCEAVELSLHSGHGLEVGRTVLMVHAVHFRQGRPSKIRFKLLIPDLPRNHYGLALHLVKQGAATSATGEIKLIVFGLQTNSPKASGLQLDVSGLSIENCLSHDASELA